MEECVTQESATTRMLLIRLGILPDKKGFNYLADSIVLFSHGNKQLKDVYAEVCQKYNVTSCNLDRCMRTCIHGVSTTDVCDKINKMLRQPMLDGKTIFTCSNFIAILSEYIRYQSILF